MRICCMSADSDMRISCWAARHRPVATVANALARRGALVAVNGTQQKAAIVRGVIDGMRHPAIDLTGKPSLSCPSGLLERCALLVSNHTGPQPLALAVGTPRVGIYRLTNLVQ